MGVKYASFNPNNTVAGFYDSEMSPVPETITDYVEISYQAWLDLLAAQSQGKLLTRGPDGMPLAVDAPPPTAADILATNTAKRNQLLSAATLAIAPLQDAVDFDEATPSETALLKAWKQFRIAVNRVDLTLATPLWPQAPQPGYGAAQAPLTQTS